MEKHNKSRIDFLLPCFIHYCIGANRTKIDVERIININSKKYNNALILIDGYDEISHLVNDNNPDIKDIKEKMFECPNIILTSRPNAIKESEKETFNVQLENIGLDDKGIKKYIGAYFTLTKKKKVKNC